MYKSDHQYAPDDMRMKLCIEDVRDIRRAYACGVPITEIHDRYAATGISYSGLLQVLAGRSWNWIEQNSNWRTEMRKSRKLILSGLAYERRRSLLERRDAERRERDRLLELWEEWARAFHPVGSRKWPVPLLQIAHICRDNPNGLTLQAMANTCGVSRERIRQVLKIPYANQ